MGVSVHYRGSLTDKRQIQPLINELEDIAQSIQAKCRVFDEDWNEKPDAHLEHNSAGQATIVGNIGLKGVSLQLHERCETLFLCFDASGVLTSPIQVAFRADSDYAVDPDHWLSVKTQFAGAKVHVALVELLRYLKGKYIHDLEVDDEAGYWGNQDITAVERDIDLINRGIDAIANRLETIPTQDTDDIVKQITIALRRMKEREDEQNE